MSEETKLYYQPKEAGAYVIGDSLHFYMETKPNRFHRFMTRVLLGWVWVDHHE